MPMYMPYMNSMASTLVPGVLYTANNDVGAVNNNAA